MRSPVRAASAILALILGMALVLSPGCGAGRKEAVRGPERSPVPTGPKVAVAPLENRSNDLDASEIIRSAFTEVIVQMDWNVMPLAESDRVLRERLGISYGGQLNAVTPGEVCLALGADAVFYGEVQEWNKTTTGIYNSVSVAAEFRLYRKDGSLAWQGSDRQYSKSVPRAAGKEIVGEVVAHALMNLLMKPMTPHGIVAGKNIARQLPAGGFDRIPNETAPGKPDEPVAAALPPDAGAPAAESTPVDKKQEDVPKGSGGAPPEAAEAARERLETVEPGGSR